MGMVLDLSPFSHNRRQRLAVHFERATIDEEDKHSLTVPASALVATACLEAADDISKVHSYLLRLFPGRASDQRAQNGEAKQGDAKQQDDDLSPGHFFFLPLRLSASLNSLATLCEMPAFLAKAGLCAAAAMNFFCFLVFDGIRVSHLGRSARAG